MAFRGGSRSGQGYLAWPASPPLIDIVIQDIFDIMSGCSDNAYNR
ncbi:hypothetical protein BN433_1803 [Erwinia amylovora Ea266]|nr:hypothetical protein BN433_1803 [Erwinia amylovora Ea266]